MSKEDLVIDWITIRRKGREGDPNATVQVELKVVGHPSVVIMEERMRENFSTAIHPSGIRELLDG